MTNTNGHLLSIVRDTREDLVKRSTDIAFSSADVPIPRPAVEQMMRACVGLIEEALVGESTQVRDEFLETLPDVARATTWDSTMRGGLPCWGVLVGQLVGRASAEHREEATQFLSRFMGAWWADVSLRMLPVIIADNRLK